MTDQAKDFPVKTQRQPLNHSPPQIEIMPPDFGRLNELQELNLNNNRLKEFPNDKIDVMGSLMKLELNNNFINNFPESMPYLYRMEILLASNNNITVFPKDLFKMKALREIDVSENLIEDIGRFWEKFWGFWPNLAVLRVFFPKISKSQKPAKMPKFHSSSRTTSPN